MIVMITSVTTVMMIKTAHLVYWANKNIPRLDQPMAQVDVSIQANTRPLVQEPRMGERGEKVTVRNFGTQEDD